MISFPLETIGGMSYGIVLVDGELVHAGVRYMGVQDHKDAEDTSDSDSRGAISDRQPA